MITAVVVLPCPPALLPGATGASRVPEVERLRTSCLTALRPLTDDRIDRILVIGAGRPGEGSDAKGSVVPAGRRLTPWPERESEPLPMALAVGAALLAEAGLAGPRFCGVYEDSAAEVCRQVGGALAELDGRTALVVMADGSARRSATAPGYLDDRAVSYDAEIQRAVTEGDTAALAALDPDLATQLWAGGRAAWQVLAGALQADGRHWRGEFLYSDDPFGVWYGVARLAPTG